MVQPLAYPLQDPLQTVVDFLEKTNNDQIASDVLDVYALHSHHIEQVNLLAKLYLDIRNMPKAEEFALKVLAMSQTDDQKYNARANLAKVYNNINEPEQALIYLLQNQQLTPNDPDVKLEIVFSHYLLNQKDKAESILRQMKTNEHLLSERHRNIVNFNLGTYDMEAGKFLQGLGGFLINVKKLDLWFSPKELPYKYWDGGAYPGKTLILYMEGGGIGDEFITIRWMDNLKQLGFNPVYCTLRPEIFSIFSRCGYNVTMSDKGFDPQSTMWTYAMQTPLWLQIEPEQVLREKYLWASTEARQKWKFVKDSRKIKVGIRWQGNSKNERDLHRQVPLDKMIEALNQVFEDKDVEYYSLQLGDGSELVSNYPQLIDVTNQIVTYDDTLALLENMDYVVSSCTSVLHASAIVGTKTIGMIPISAYFTWLSPPLPGRPDNTSIWYGDNLRVFKQVKPKNWDQPLEQMKTYLRSIL